LTYEAYLVNAAKLFEGKGAQVIISSATPNNVFESGTFSYSANRFLGYASDAAKNSGSTFIDHGQTTADAYKALGERASRRSFWDALNCLTGATTVNSFYPNDHTHTSPAGADVVAKAFAQGLKTSSSSLKNYVKGV
jgi:rhamnogalacturonan acetylesterase